MNKKCARNLVLLMLLAMLMGCSLIELSVTKRETPSAGNAFAPIIMFSDLESAPASGWSSEDSSQGAAVSIWGRNFGDSRGSSYVTINGVKLSADADYAVWGDYWPTPFWQRITFWLHDGIDPGDSQITVTRNGRVSNELPFTVREGRIFFVDSVHNDIADGSLANPFVHTPELEHKVNAIQPGDIWYFRDGVYTDRVGMYGRSILSMSTANADGTREMPIAFLAYPGEKPELRLPEWSINFSTAVTFRNEHVTFSGFKLDSEFIGASLQSYHRFIGNDVVGLKAKYQSGTGIINTFGSGNRILGNTVRGGRSQDRYDHAVYFSGAPVDEGSHLGWNYIHDNDFGRGPEIAINHEGDRVPEDQFTKSHFVFANIVDAYPQRATFINIYNLGETLTEPEPVFVYNNVFMNGGTLDKSNRLHIGWAHGISISKDHSRFYNNILYNIGYSGFHITEPLSTAVHNNIVVMNSDVVVDDDRHYYARNPNKEHLQSVSNNLFYDIGSGDMRLGDVDTGNNLVGKNPLFRYALGENPYDWSISLHEDSPYWDIRTDDLPDTEMLPDYAPLDQTLFILLGD